MRRFCESDLVQHFIVGIIILNSIVLGMLAQKDISSEMSTMLENIDVICMCIFCTELLVKLFVYKKSFFFDVWNLFDLVVIIPSILFTAGYFSVLRAFRIFKILKFISMFPALRIIVKTIFATIPSITWISTLLLLIFYIFAVIGNNLFATDFDSNFGSLSSSMFSLFQIMTLDGWVDQIAGPVIERYPASWIYFISFIVLTAVIILNVFVGMIVESITHISSCERIDDTRGDCDDIGKELYAVREHLERIDLLINKRN